MRAHPADAEAASRMLLLSCAVALNLVAVTPPVVAQTTVAAPRVESPPPSIDWSKRLKKAIDADVMAFLRDAKYQEAIWVLEDRGATADAFSVKNHLRFILEHGKIQEVKPFSAGVDHATETLKVYLPNGIKGVFKPKSMHIASDYKAEIAAFIIDQLGDFRLVPMTVERKVEGRDGSLQYFVRGAEMIEGKTGYTTGKNLNVFDYIIFNRDPNERNILLANGREIGIDHGCALRVINPLGRTLIMYDHINNALGREVHPVRQRRLHPKENIEEFMADERIVNRLRTFTFDMLEESLQEWLSTATIEKVLEKTHKFLALYDAEAKSWEGMFDEL